MSRIELAIAALRALPDNTSEEVADLVLDIVANVTRTGESVLSEQQWAEIDRRRARGFVPARPDHFDKLMARLSEGDEDETRN